MTSEQTPECVTCHRASGSGHKMDCPNRLAPEPVVLDIDALEAAARAASPGLWEAEWSDETIELNKGTALTKWNDERTVGTPARSWASRDRLIEFDVEWMGEDEAAKVEADIDYIAAARPEVVLALIERLRAAEARLVPTADVPRVGQWAHHKTVDLDRRRVVEVNESGTMIRLFMITKPSSWLHASQYTFVDPTDSEVGA